MQTSSKIYTFKILINAIEGVETKVETRNPVWLINTYS